MSASQSFLSAYGYDFVVATTQASINATMKQYLSASTQPEVKICYVADASGLPTAIAYDDLVRKANGSDPFSVPDGADPATNKDLVNLFNARFMVGFKARIGLPAGIPPAQIPDIVTLGSDTSQVIFNLMCSEFVVVQYTPQSGYAPASWMNKAQPPGNPWLFTSKVDLRLFATDRSAYSKLPPAVQAQIANMGSMAFSVQQLLFDLDNAGLQSIPTISGVEPGTTLYHCLQTDFLEVYFHAMQAAGAPLLGCSITQGAPDPSTLGLTNINLEVCPYVDAGGMPVPNPTPAQADLYTLNYLCAADNATPRPPMRLNWNWLETNEAYDGVISINRNTFANYFRQQLAPYVCANSFLAWVRVWLTGWFDETINYSWLLTPYQTPTVAMPASGPTVLQFSYTSNAQDDAGAGGDMGSMQLNPTFTLSVDFTGNTIVVTQHLTVWLYVRVLATSAGANIIDRTITDTYTLAVDAAGRLTAAMTTTSADSSKDPRTDPFLNFFTNLNQIIEDISTWTRNFVSPGLGDIPLTAVQNFVFPGGAVFTYKDVSFSGNQDLVGRITYADPTGRVSRSSFWTDQRSTVSHRIKAADARPAPVQRKKKVEA